MCLDTQSSPMPLNQTHQSANTAIHQAKNSGIQRANVTKSLRHLQTRKTLTHGPKCRVIPSRTQLPARIHSLRQIQSHTTRSPPQLPPQITVAPLNLG